MNTHEPGSTAHRYDRRPAAPPFYTRPSFLAWMALCLLGALLVLFLVGT